MFVIIIIVIVVIILWTYESCITIHNKIRQMLEDRLVLFRYRWNFLLECGRRTWVLLPIEWLKVQDIVLILEMLPPLVGKSNEYIEVMGL